MEKIIRPGLTQRKFILSSKTVIVLIGPQGEGKSWAVIAAMLYQAQKATRKLRGAIVRDAFTNIERNTIPSIQRMLGPAAMFTNGGRKMQTTNLDVDLFGVGDLASLSTLQGSEYDLAWLEEPAPIYETGNAGLREEVFDIFYSRGSRELDSFHKVFVSQNPGDEEHWTYHRFIEHPTNDMEIFNIPYGENAYLPPEERERTKKAYINRPELYARYVKGQFAFVPLGEAVTPEYNEDIHRSKIPLIPLPVLTFRFWDGGLYPTCMFFQVSPRGRSFTPDVVRGENIGMKQFIQSQVKPLMSTKYQVVEKWRDIGDPSLANREQSDSSQTAAGIIEAELGTTFEKGEMGWEVRLEAWKELLTRLVDGEAMFQHSSPILHRCLKGGWHYNVNSSGVVNRDIPVKDIHSHPGDAGGHGIAKIFQYQPKITVRRIDTRNIGRSYAVKTL